MGARRIETGCLYGPTGQRKYLDADERRRFIAAANAAPPRDRALCLTLAYTGARVSEVLALTAATLHAMEGFITIRSLKKRKALKFRDVPVPFPLFGAIETGSAFDAGQPDKRLWPITRSRAWQIVKRIMREAGIGPGLHASPKGLRHAFGINAVRSGVPLSLVQRWLGHASMATTAIYLDVMGPDEREIAARMWGSSPLR
ncbi:MAG: site-specific integrase [Phreatobacter sp.]|uniref:tyrosine-type recombinase/integrase n=1 Tax=Phreatobacter sp. TaxID=1966341 RepID=UPI001A575227|nr:site-specific integrase [Phreatobacter sp.]MBL8567938.1 site-specific integrase [Phreatobacter sp.]